MPRVARHHFGAVAGTPDDELPRRMLQAADEVDLVRAPGIEALPAKISVIRKIEVGLNINPAETWSIALYSEFDTLDDVKFYAVHPDHVAAGKLIAEVKESRACVDYEV